MSVGERREVLSGLTEQQQRELLYTWRGYKARKNQIRPPGDWRYWLVQAGRGFGKTRTGAEAIREYVDEGARIIHLVGSTAGDVRDVMVQGESGLLNCFPPEKRPLYEPSKRLVTFSTGATAHLFSADEPERLRGPQCVSGDTRVLMADGSEKPIAVVLEGEYVMTRAGARRVIRSRMTSSSADVFRLKLLDGRSIVATGDHRVCVTPVSSGTERRGTRYLEAVTTRPGYSCTAKCGRQQKGQFRQTTTFITLTEISTIIESKTCNCSAVQSITASIAGKNWLRTKRARLPVLFWQRHGIERFESRLGSLGAACAEEAIEAERGDRPRTVLSGVSTRRATSNSVARIECASSAAVPSLRSSAHRDIVDDLAISRQRQPVAEHLSEGALFAVTAAGVSSACERTRGSAPENVPLISMARIASVEALSRRIPVYDLQIEGEHEFFANGTLVHNCDHFWADELAAWRFGQEAWDNLMFGFRLGDDPRGIITTTPKPIKLLIDIIADPHTVITRASSYENRANLAPAFFDSIIRKYEGTRIGRQELDAELLDDVPGALWTQMLIDAYKIRLNEIKWDQLVRIVVAIDPAVTAGENSDDTGIVVAALTDTAHVIVIEDLTCKESPLQWARVAVAAFNRHKADKIVGEVNNGGDLVEMNIRAVSPNAPFHAVRASRGKSVRAEPVAALYEQGRVHHVGNFPELEQQMCSFVPGISGKSPDRMDALVWAVYELLLDPDQVVTTRALFGNDRVVISRF